MGGCKLIKVSTLAFLVLLIACRSDKKNQNRPLIQVNDEVLTIGMLSAATPNNLSKDDSIVFANDYQKRWIRTKLLLQRAELNLTADEKNVEELLSEYRTSLLVYRYQQKLVEQKYQSNVTEEEIDKYYRENEETFKLWAPIVKGGYIRIARNAPDISGVESQLKSFRSTDITSLEGYCFKNAKAYKFFPDEWLSYSTLEDELNLKIDNIDDFLAKERFYSTIINDEKVMLVISDYQPSGTLAPINFVKDRIRAIIVNKKRLEFIKKMEDEIYDDGITTGVVKFYK